MSEFLSAAASALGAPELIVQRSAEAKAKATGTPVDDILKAWAGGEAVAAPAAPPAAAEPEPAPAPAPTPAAEPESTPQPEPTPTPAEAPSEAPASVITPPPAPSEVTAEEALSVPVVVSVPTAGLTERTATSLPRWLAAAFMLIPALGLLYLAGTGTADAGCEEGGFTLAIDRVSGVVENCDGSAFEGRSAGGGEAAVFLALGEELYSQCAACHGANGGGGVGPALSQVTVVFGSCSDQAEWVRLGTNGFREAGIATYGDLAKPVGGGGVMPAFGQLSDEQLASVVSFVRVRFGGGNADEVLTDCGLTEGEEGEGTDGEMPEEAPADEIEASAGN
jgi:mono/diheme cytochrome c family protein